MSKEKLIGKQYRSIGNIGVVIDAAASEGDAAKPKKLRGYAATWDKYDMGSNWEQLSPTCFGETYTGEDIVLLRNHNDDLPMGRVGAGNLRLFVDERGLGFECDLPDKQSAQELYADIQSGICSKCSFGFYCDEDEFSEVEGGGMMRTITKATLFEISAGVVFPANPNTESQARSKPAEETKQPKRRGFRKVMPRII